MEVWHFAEEMDLHGRSLKRKRQGDGLRYCSSWISSGNAYVLK
jgi:hypothetical protein